MDRTRIPPVWDETARRRDEAAEWRDEYIGTSPLTHHRPARSVLADRGDFKPIGIVTERV
jgi:hypothetical protein